MEIKKMIPKRKKRHDSAEEQEDVTIIMPDQICMSCGRREDIPEGYWICGECRKKAEGWQII